MSNEKQLSGNGIGRGDIEPHLRTRGETEELFPRLEDLAAGLCQTQSFILNELARAGLTVVLLDPSARDVAPDAAALRVALAAMLELVGHAESKDPHSPWCNGVHAEPTNYCEGDYIASGIIEQARAALAADEPRAAPPISLEEQAQPDAQDLTEEEIGDLVYSVKNGSGIAAKILLPRLIAEVKRRRGIK